MTDTPWARSGMIESAITAGAPSAPSIFGIEYPHTSASITPTVWPRPAMLTAKLVVTEDLPTPPFPDDTAMT